MVDGLKILDTFEYKGVQGFVHADMSLSSVIRLEEFGELMYMKDIDRERYYSSKENIVNGISPYGSGAKLPMPVKSIGGSLYQYFSIPNESIEQELTVIQNSNNNQTFFKSLLDQVVIEEMEKLTKNFSNLKKYESCLFVRTYLSGKEEKDFSFKIGRKKYDKKNFVSLYTVLLENNIESEYIKEDLFKALNLLFEKHKAAVGKFGTEVYTEEEISSEVLIKDNPQNKLLDILGQINIIRSFYTLPKKKIYSQHNQPTFQIFDTPLIFEKDTLKIETGRMKYILLDKRNEPLIELYEDESNAVVIENIKEFETTVEYNSYVLDNLNGEMSNLKKGIYIAKEDAKENYQAQFPYTFLVGSDKDITIKKEKLYKHVNVYNLETIPENSSPRMGEMIIKRVNQEFSEKIIKASYSINFYKAPDKQVLANLNMEKMAWTTVNSLPSIRGLFYDPLIVAEKIEAIEELKIMVRKSQAKFVISQLYLTIVSYKNIDLLSELETMFSSSEFGIEIVKENFVNNQILFGNASPLSFNPKTIKMDKEIMLTYDDLEDMINLSVGPSQFSLTRPVIIGISGGSRICYIDTYDPRIEAPNGIVVGATGSGKSFTKIYELIKLLFLPVHPLIIIIDRGGSFINFVKIFGGKAVTLNLSSPKNNINPFIYTDDFKTYIILLSKHLDNVMTKDNIINQYKDKSDTAIYEMDNGNLYTMDENQIYHLLLPNDLSPQSKLNFFIRIVLSMSQTKKADFKKIVSDILLDIIDDNKKTFKKRKVIYKNTIVIKDKETDKIVFNINETLKSIDSKNIQETETYFVQEYMDKVVVLYKDIEGYEKTYENSYIYKYEEEEDIFEEMLYFTVQDIMEKVLLYGDMYKDEANIMDTYVSLTGYGNLFNGPPALNFDEELLWTVDMGEETPDDLAAIILQSLNIVQWNSILSPLNKARKKMIIFDEVHQILANVADTGPAEAIGYMYRTIRKHGGGIHILSQSSADIFKNSDEVPTELLNTFNGIKSNAMYKYIIGINSDDAKRSKEDFQLTDTEIAEIVNISEKKSTVASMRGMIYIKTKAFKGFLNVIATPTIYAIATTMKEEKNLQESIEKIIKENELVKGLFVNYDITDEVKQGSIITSIKIVIFKTLFPRGISSIYQSKDIFLKKHVDKQPDGVDKYKEGFKDFLYQTNNEERFNDLVKNEIRKLEEQLL